MNFILYEDEEQFVNIYEKVIDTLMGKTNNSYKIHTMNRFDKKKFDEIKDITGNKIYIIDIQVPEKNGLDFARMIRKKGDWLSPIIVLTSHKEFQVVGFTGKILMLDFIVKDSNIKNSLKDALKLALKINSSKPSFQFSYKGDYFSIPYDNIIYFEKCLNDNSSIVVCDSEDYVVRKTISEIAVELQDTVFLKTHRSCVVNLNKVMKVDYDNGIIYFKNNKINLLSRNNKKELKEKMRHLYGISA